jgi:hypothetical protein
MSSGSRSRRCCPPIWGAAVIRSATIVVWSRIIYRYRTGVPWRDLPREQFGPWKTVWKRHRRYAGDGTWDTVLAALLAQADADGKIEWTVSVDATINRAHQHATNTTRPDQDTQGARSNYTKPPEGFVSSPQGGAREPAGHGVGRSRGGLTTKIHAAVDRRGRALAVARATVLHPLCMVLSRVADRGYERNGGSPGPAYGSPKVLRRRSISRTRASATAPGPKDRAARRVRSPARPASGRSPRASRRL